MVTQKESKMNVSICSICFNKCVHNGPYEVRTVWKTAQEIFVLKAFSKIGGCWKTKSEIKAVKKMIQNHFSTCQSNIASAFCHVNLVINQTLLCFLIYLKTRLQKNNLNNTDRK